MKKYALIVGVSRYDDPDIGNLNFAAEDAREVGDCLTEICGFDEVRTLVSGGEREPDHISVVEELNRFAPILNPDDLFLFYFAGHGIHTANGSFLLASNSRIRMPELAAVPMPLLQQCLSRLDAAERVLILDACRNDPQKGRGDSDNLLTQEFSRDILSVAKAPCEGVSPATCVLFSCSEGERAYEWADRKHGAFTWYLLDGMRGAALDPQGRLTVQGLSRYVEEQVPRWSHKAGTPHPQTPWAQQLGSLREIFLRPDPAGMFHKGRPTSSNDISESSIRPPTPADIKKEIAKSAASLGETPVRAPVAGFVLRISTQAGKIVTRGQELLVMDANKLEFSISAPCDGRISSIIVNEGARVSMGAVLATVEKTIIPIKEEAKEADYEEGIDHPTFVRAFIETRGVFTKKHYLKLVSDSFFTHDREINLSELGITLPRQVDLSPDGNRVLFIGGSHGLAESGQLYIISSNGSNLVCLRNVELRGETIEYFKSATWESVDAISAEVVLCSYDFERVKIHLTSKNRVSK